MRLSSSSAQQPCRKISRRFVRFLIETQRAGTTVHYRLARRESAPSSKTLCRLHCALDAPTSEGACNTPFPADMLRSGLNGSTEIAKVAFNGRDSAIVYAPMLDYRGDVIGTYVLISDISKLSSIMDAAMLASGVVGLVSIMAALFCAWLLNRWTVAPVRKMTRTMTALAHPSNRLNTAVPCGHALPGWYRSTCASPSMLRNTDLITSY